MLRRAIEKSHVQLDIQHFQLETLTFGNPNFETPRFSAGKFDTTLEVTTLESQVFQLEVLTFWNSEFSVLRFAAAKLCMLEVWAPNLEYFQLEALTA